MDEYITRNNAISAVCFGCNQQFSNEPCEPSECTIRQSIMALPTAEVAPKSEVAREIFEEIEKYNRSPLPECKPVYILKDGEFAELKKKYTEGE